MLTIFTKKTIEMLESLMEEVVAGTRATPRITTQAMTANIQTRAWDSDWHSLIDLLLSSSRPRRELKL